jgi:signal transduction histidine kinase
VSDFINKIGRSIFFKLVLVFVVTALIMVTAVSTIVRYVVDESPYRGLIGKNMAQYSLFIIDEIGVPPDTRKAQQFADRFRVAMRIKSPAVTWQSKPPPPAHLPGTLANVSGFENVQAARIRGQIFLRVNHAETEYSFVFGRHGNWGGHSNGGILLLVILVVGVILTMSYLVVRWLFKPLGWLTTGMQQMSGGNLDTTIPIRKHDELGDLAATFNDMSMKIRDQVRARQQLLLDVSHELRSPLTRMKLAAEFIAEDRIKNRITADLDEMEAMTAEILESERLTSDQGGLVLEQVDLRELVADLAAMYDGRPPGVDVCAEQPVKVVVDPERIRMMLRNVVDNALKYSQRQTRPVEIRLGSNRDHAVVTIEDFGEGIPGDDLAMVFEPFYRVDKSRHRETGGYGLGLSLCRKIIAAHGGSIDVQSRVGEGTMFTIEIPKKTPGSQ